MVRCSKRNNCSDDRLSFSLSLSLFLRFNLNAQICDGYNGEFDSFGKKKGKKRFLVQKRRHVSAVCSALSFPPSARNKKSDFLSFSLSLSFSHFFSLSLSLSINSLVILLVSESMMCSGS